MLQPNRAWRLNKVMLCISDDHKLSLQHDLCVTRRVKRVKSRLPMNMETCFKKTNPQARQQTPPQSPPSNQPTMLAIQKPKIATQTCTPNILPCKIHHNGPVNASSRHWDPKTSHNGKEEAYFRGRRLQGHTVKLPDGYQGSSCEARQRRSDLC